MKTTFSLLAIASLILWGCSNAKEITLDNEPLLKVIDPYWMEIIPGQQDAIKSKVLLLPVKVSLNSYAVDSVYWKGYHRELTKSMMQGKEVYRVQISEDEKKFAGELPYAITEDQALVSYLDKMQQKRYFKVENIVQVESVFMP